jgi:AraC-like DNA-binding protein
MTAGQDSERIEIHRPPDMPGIEVMRAKSSARRWHVFHETYTVCTVYTGGVAEWIYRQKTHEMRLGSLALMEPGEVHANTRITPRADFDVLLIDPSLVARAARELGMTSSQPHLKFADVADPAIVRLFAQFHASLDPESSLLERQSRLAACVQALLERCAETPAAIPSGIGMRQGLTRAQEFIRERYKDSISLDDLAMISGLSRYHLVRTFAAAFGLPPHAFQIHVRIEKARPLLAAGISPAIIAADTGFADQSHFIRHFRRIYGITPRQYSRQ